METAMLDAAMMSLSENFEAAYDTPHPALRAMDAFTILALKNPVAVTNFDRYETRYERAYYKALNGLLALRRKRSAPSATPASEAASQTVTEAPVVIPKPVRTETAPTSPLIR